MSVFLTVPEEEVLYRDALFFIIRDLYPVSPGHLLIISCAERTDYFTLMPAEQEHLPQLKHLIERDFQLTGYNIGMNCEPAAPLISCYLTANYLTNYVLCRFDPCSNTRS